jgi:hypothetical protein
MGLHATLEEARAILKEASDRLDWTWDPPQRLDDHDNAVGRVGRVAEFTVSVVKWSDGDEQRYDGALSKRATIVHLTPEQARTFFERSEAMGHS